MAGSDGGPEIGTHCRRWARTNDGADSTGARLAGRIVKECLPRGAGSLDRELLGLSDAVLRERRGEKECRRWRLAKNLRWTCKVAQQLLR
jgi:hypothetical protein